MFKLVKFAFVVGALAAVWTLVPVAGRTLDARWRSAGSLGAFARASWADLERAFAAPREARPAPARDRAPAQKAARPTESVTDQDRHAVDRILAEHLKR